MNYGSENGGEKTIYELFRVSVWLKALGSVGEMIAGASLALIPGAFVLQYAVLLTQGSLDGDADDFIAQGILHAAHSFAISNDWLIGVYLFVRGLVQFLLVIALFRNKVWAYPLLILVLIFLVCSQGYAVYLSHSIPTAILTIIDAATIYLVAHEWSVVRRALTNKQA